MKIRFLTSNDWSKLRDIRMASFASDPQAFGGNMLEESTRSEKEWRERLESVDRYYVVAEEDDVIVSLAGTVKTKEGPWLLVSVYTRPEFRGRSLAQKLVIRLCEKLNENGIDIIRLMVNIDQKDAVHLYKKVGFDVIKTLHGEMMSDGKHHDVYLMEKCIGA